MAHDFFGDEDQRPQSIIDAEKSDKFDTKHIEEEGPKFLDEEPKEEVIEASTPVEKVEEEVAAEAKAEELEEKIEEALDAPEDTKEQIEDKIKLLNALYEEKEYNIPADAKLRHKVDKEEVEVSIQELLNNYSGKQSWDKKFTELDSERSAYKQDLDNVNKYINEFAEVSKKDKVEGLIKLAEAVGIDPLEYKKQLRSELLNKYGEYLAMDENQRSMFDQKEELDYLRRKQETEMSRREQEQANKELMQRYTDIQQTHSIDNDRLNYLADELQNVYQAEVSPENVLELHNSLSRLDRVEDALKTLDPEFVNDDNKVIQLESLLKGTPDMTDKGLLELASKLYGNDVEKAVANLAKRAPIKKEEAKKQEKPHNYSPKLNHVGPNINFFD